MEWSKVRTGLYCKFLNTALIVYHVLCAALACIMIYTSNYAPFMVTNGKAITVTRDYQMMSMEYSHAIS